MADNIKGGICVAIKIRSDKTISAKGSIQITVGIILDQGKIVITAGIRATGDQQISIIQRYYSGGIISSAPVSDDFPPIAKGGINTSISLVFHHSEISLICIYCVTNRQYLIIIKDKKLITKVSIPSNWSSDQAIYTKIQVEISCLLGI